MAGEMILVRPYPLRTLPVSFDFIQQRIVLQSLLRFACTLWLGIASGCPHSQPPPANLPLVTTTDREAEAELRSARQLQEAGDNDEARAAYQAFLQKHPNDPLASVARVALAQLHLADGDGRSATTALAPVIDHEDPAVRERVRFYNGLALGKLGDHQAAIDALTPMVGHTVDPSETALLLNGLADAYLATGRVVDGLRMLDQLAVDAVPEEARAEALARIDEVVAAVDATHLATVFGELDRSGASWPRVALRSLIAADAARDVPRAREILAAMTERGVELSPEAQEIAARSTRPAEADPQVVGVVLTLSGRAREVGEVALRGIMLAAGLPPTGPRAPNAPQVIFRDDAGDPARAVQAVDELVSVHRAVAIIGPMDGVAARAAAARAQELGVPLITLTAQADINRAGTMVFRLFASPDEEARALVSHAVSQGKRRFCVLRPDTTYGSMMEAAFRSAIAAHGAEFLGATTYLATATAFGPEITRLAAQPFDALLVADSARKLELIAPALAAGGLWSTPNNTPAPSSGRAILLLSPSIGFGPQLSRTVGRYLQGAVFSVPFSSNALSAGERTFTEGYRRQFDAAPDGFAAFAHDAYRMVRTAVDRGSRTRAELAVALTRVEATDVAGPSGGFSNDRAPRTATRLLQLSGTELVSVTTTAPLR